MRFDHPGQRELPLFPLNTVLLPGMTLPLHIFEPRYRQLLRDRAGQNPAFGIVLIRQGAEVGDEPEPCRIGTAVAVTGVRHYPDGRVDIVVHGGQRFRVLASDWSTGYLTASVDWLDEHLGDAALTTAGLDDAVREFHSFVGAMRGAIHRAIPFPPLPRDPTALSYAMAAHLPLNNRERQELLELDTTAARLAALGKILRRERRLLVETGAGAGILHPIPQRFSPN